jgi:hypothetical protein
MSEYDELFSDTQRLHKLLRWYFERFQDRQCAERDNGTLSDYNAAEHTLIEAIYAHEKRLRELEGIIKGSTGAEHEQPVEIPLSVNHIAK